MGKIYQKTCRCCGEQFETTIAGAAYCQKDACQENKLSNRKELIIQPRPEEDMPLGVIAQIMREERISYTRYTERRSKYIERWKNRTE